MNGLLKRFKAWLNETGSPLSTAPQKTAYAQLGAVERRRSIAGGRTTPSYEIPPIDRENRVSEAFKRVGEVRQTAISPLVREFRVDLDEALGMPDLVVVNGARFLPEQIDESRKPRLAEVNAIRLNLAQRIVFERDARRTRTANVMRSASDMLGLLSKELTAQDRRLFDMTAQRDGFEGALDVREAEVVTLRGQRDSARELADQADGYLRRAEAAESRAEQFRQAILDICESKDKRIEAAEGRAEAFRQAIVDNAGALSNMAAERDAATAARDMMQSHLADMTTARDALDEICQRKDEHIRTIEIERDTARDLAAMLGETLNGVRNYLAKEVRFAPTVKIIDAALATETMTGGHANTEAEAVERDAQLNCPTCGGSGHIDDVPEGKAGEVAEILAMLERSAVWFEDKATGENPESARLLRKTATLVGRLAKDRENALAQVTALSQPRVINVAGLVDADLAERYESLRQSFELVRPKEYSNEERDRVIAEYLKRFAGPPDHASPRVDIIAEAFGMKRAGQ